MTDDFSVSFKATKLTIVNPVAVDLSSLMAVVVKPQQLQSLQPADLSGKVLVVELSGPGAGGSSFNSDLATAVRKLEPAAAIVLRNGGRPLPAQARLRYPGAKSALPVIHLFDAEVHRAVIEGGDEVTVSLHVPPPAEKQFRLRNAAACVSNVQDRGEY